MHHLQRAPADVSAVVRKVAAQDPHVRLIVHEHRPARLGVAITNGAPHESHPRRLHKQSTRPMSTQHGVCDGHLAADNRESPFCFGGCIGYARLDAAAVELQSAALDPEATDEAHVGDVNARCTPRSEKQGCG
eukprot:2503096-Prymnesium_polylepis.1